MDLKDNFEKTRTIFDKMQKLLIIGAGIGQVPLLKKAKARGIHVTVVSIPGNYPCFDLADDVIYMDIYDRDGIVVEAKKRGITAVISDQNDLMMPTVAYVAEKLGLPGNKFETVMTFCNKNRFREMCDAAGVPCPKHKSVSKATIDAPIAMPFPLMVKPADSQSSIGVKKVNNEQELKEALEFAISKSPTGNAIVEEFFQGREVVCEGFMHEGKYYLLQFADRKYFDRPGVLIPSQTLFPSTLKKEFKDRIVECESKLAAYSKPSFAIVHSEYLINEETGEIRVVESALRGGGVYISSDLIPMATGIDINDVLLRKALGEEVDVDKVFEQRMENASAYVCFYLNEGTICSVKGVDELKSLSFVHEAYINDLQVGQKTGLPTYKGARKGPILVYGDNRDDLEQHIKVVRDVLRIEVVDYNDNYSSINWE